jgi:hypothetical protein
VSMRLSRKRKKVSIKEIVILFHSLDIEKKQLFKIQEKMKNIELVRMQLAQIGLNTDSVDTLLKTISNERDYSLDIISTLNTLIPEKVDKEALRITVKEYLRYEETSFIELSREMGIPYTEVEMFLKTGNADDYLTIKLFEYFQCN